MSIKRQSVFFIIVGLNGTGKTTLLHKFIDTMPDRKLLVIDPDGMEWRELHTAICHGLTAKEIEDLYKLVSNEPKV